jgi:opacity protein-like surface antigen
MKKLILAASILIAATSFVSAQKISLIGKVGANFSKIDGKEFSDSYNSGFHAGGAIEINFTKFIGIQPEVLFSQTKTTTASAGTTGLNLNKDVQLDYLSIPLLLRINVTKLLTIHVGPEYSILVSNDKNMYQNGQDAFKSGNFSMIGGVQLNLASLRIYGRYNVGLSSIEDAPNTDKWKSQQIQLGIGFKLF